MFLFVFSKASIFIIVVDHVRDLNFGTFKLPHSSFYRHVTLNFAVCLSIGVYMTPIHFSLVKKQFPHVTGIRFCNFFYIVYLYTDAHKTLD